MRRTLSLCIMAALCLFIVSCASYHSAYVSPHHTQDEIKEKNDGELVHTSFLIGDAGGSPIGQIAPALVALKRHLMAAGKESSVIFLGDNIYPDGLPKKDEEGREAAEWALKVQLDAIKDYKGRRVIMPGNHDWRRGLKGILRQEDYVEDYLDKKHVFLPEKGCAGPEVVKLTDQLIMLVIDTEWWLQNWDKEPEINADCEVTTRDELIRAYTDVLKKNRTKDIIVAFHHPLYSYGAHGGYFPVKDHLFPLAKAIKGFYLPMPIIGSLYPLLRGSAGVKQDNNYGPFDDFRSKIMLASGEFENLIFVAGHEHNLQYITEQRHPFIVSGSGSKGTPLNKGKNLEFGSTDHGFVALDSYRDGTMIARFITVDDDGNDQVVFTRQIKGPRQVPTQFDFSEYESGQEIYTKSIYDPASTQKKGFYRMIWGDWWRAVYGQQLEVPTLDLSTKLGGLEPIRRGGGMQTSSLRLEDKDGRHYAIRAMEKNADNLLPRVFKNTFAAEMMRDFFTTAHPYAAFVIPKMADAINIYHANPKLYYLPKQPALGAYNENFGGELYLFEERPAGDRSDVESFGRSEDIISSLDLLEKLEKNDNHRLDRSWIIRSRLFDLTLSDWDRHEDQWRWASFEDEERDLKIYRPIPRDRDQAFAKFDGFLTRLATRSVINLRPMQTFPEMTKKVHWLTWGTRFFDRRFLNEISWDEWKNEIKYIQQHLTDEVIEDALSDWPQKVYSIEGDRIVRTLKKRRDNLGGMALQLYRFLARSVDVVGTQKPDYFLVERLDAGKTRVSVYRNNDKAKKNRIYQRLFDANETKEIILYGLEGKDYFEVTGDVRSGTVIRMVGGQGNDHFVDRSNVTGGKKHTLVYDDLRKNEIEKSKETKDKRTFRRLTNEYHFREFRYNYTLGIPFAAFLSDDGFFLGGFVTHDVGKFKKIPYGQRHTFGVTYAFATQAFKLSWRGEYSQALGKLDFMPRIHFQTPSYAQNFYGFGNDTDDTGDIEFHRVRNKVFRVATGIRRQFKSGAAFEFTPQYEQIKVEQTEDRVITQPSDFIRDGIFENQSYLGLDISFSQDNKNNLGYPTRGMIFNGNVSFRNNLDQTDRAFLKLDQNLTFYLPLSKSQLFVYATRIETNQIFGDFDFYHGVTLGGLQSLRGFRVERFTGRASVAHSNDLRFPLFTVRNNLLPFAVGLTGSFDYGRVWTKELESDTWHTSVGGSLWFNFVSAAVLRAGVYSNGDDTRVVIGLGYAL